MLEQAPSECFELTLQAYQQLIEKKTDGHMLWQDLGIMEKLGVTEGTLEVKS